MLSAIRMNLVDPDTPESAYKKKAKDGSEWVLVFSDEFDAEGRTFMKAMINFSLLLTFITMPLKI